MDRITLPDGEWRHRPGLDRLAEVLGARDDRARLVGGAVRDTLLRLPVHDIDIATRHAPEQVLALLKAAGIRAVPTGLAHGTITAVLESGPVEVTTLRRDVATDGRHATVAFTDAWEEDAARRDFTMNALYADPASGTIFDYFDGLADLDARRVRFIGDPYRRIAEDHLRILRFFRFLARFGDAPDPEGLAACAARANDLMALSRERIAEELLKLLVARDAVRVVSLMIEHGIFRPVLPEITAAGVARLERCADSEAAAEISPDPIRRLAALLPDDPKLAEGIATRLKLSKAHRNRLTSAVVPDLMESPYRAAYLLGREGAIDRMLVHVAEPTDAVIAARHLSHWEVPRLPLTGGALIARGLSKGPDVARTLRRVEDRWIDEGFPDAARVSEIADAEVAQALRS
ncbi:CCA tRNA nucleotidyltransferase [Sphingosinithalassobacter sp. CS137]|uniref:CCA tRNA nucleotidyltransferase n=1 Tax=Sphingosinithalassobacter sp. CS137 TaxID=2762748 RepID=UPI00165E717F|nr:CCA tRNA nucleotidyltransferase [Sphingosinithalassobacter sp. CS137]